MACSGLREKQRDLHTGFKRFKWRFFRCAGIKRCHKEQANNRHVLLLCHPLKNDDGIEYRECKSVQTFVIFCEMD